MRIVCVSDTHEYHEQVQLPDGDVLIHAGDLTFLGQTAPIVRFNEWLGRQPHKHKIVIAGNHDFGMNEKSKFLTNCTYLKDSGCEIDGVSFWGSPFTPQFGDWAYMLPRGQSMFEKWLTIPHKTDVLITHGPPRGILDTATIGSEQLGCRDLANVVLGIQPKLHVFGHIHGGYGQLLLNGTHFVNAAICNEAYKPINRPIVVVL